MSGLHADTTITVFGGTFTAMDAPDDRENDCEGCAGYGHANRKLCNALPGCGADHIIWVAHDDPATITLLATLALEAA